MSDIHVMPVDDIFPHICSTECLCAPVITIENNGRIIVHNSYDGRETIETTKGES